MKRILIPLFFLFAFSIVNAQLVPRTMVVLEISTGTWCQFCPGAALGADELLSGGANVAIVEYHNGDPYANNASNARNTYYNIPGYPNDQFDGSNTTGVGGKACGNGSTYSSYLSMYNQRIGVQSPLIIDISGTNTGNNYNVVLSIKKSATISGTNLKAFLVLTESNIVTSPAWPPSGQCLTEVHFVERVMVPSETGTAISFDNGDFQVVNLSFAKDPAWVSDNCELVAFVQDAGTKEIYNGTKVALNALPPPVSVSFTGTPTTGCAPVNVNYTNTSTGVNTYQWTLPGGTPNTSASPSPTITYNTAGTFDATLTAWNSATNRGNKMSIPAFLAINAAPVAPAQPSGVTGLCVNAPDQAYVILTVPGASSYSWDLQPPSSGTLTPNNTSCSINWSNTFQGTAVLKVKGSNSCGDGLWSPPLNITLSPQPGIPGTPTGPTQLCQNSPSSIYTTTGTTPASSYTWELLPTTAGTMTANGSSVTIDWNDTYLGTVQLHVMALNNGCDGPWSEFLTINVVSGPGQYSVTGGGTFCAVGGTGLPVGLSGSQLQTNYTLYKNNVATTTIVAGTGGVISFGNQTEAGAYTVYATNTSTTCSMIMNGSAQIVVDPQTPGSPSTPQGPEQTNAGTSSNYTTTGGTYATSYSWAVDPMEAGSFTGTTATGTITWNLGYTGQAAVKVQGVNTCGGGSFSTELPVTVFPAVGVQESSIKKIAAFSPNPASGSITILPVSKMNADVRIYNSMGIIVLEKTGLTLDGKVRLDIGNLRSGIYFFVLTGKETNQVEKIIIKND